MMAARSDPFTSALATLRTAHKEYRERRLTPPAPPPPRDSDPQAGDPEPEHGPTATLPPSSAPWAWSGADGDSDDGTRG